MPNDEPTERALDRGFRPPTFLWEHESPHRIGTPAKVAVRAASPRRALLAVTAAMHALEKMIRDEDAELALPPATAPRACDCPDPRGCPRCDPAPRSIL